MGNSISTVIAAANGPKLIDSWRSFIADPDEYRDTLDSLAGVHGEDDQASAELRRDVLNSTAQFADSRRRDAMAGGWQAISALRNGLSPPLRPQYAVPQVPFAGATGRDMRMLPRGTVTTTGPIMDTQPGAQPLAYGRALHAILGPRGRGF